MRPEVIKTLQQVLDYMHQVRGKTKLDNQILETADKILLNTKDLTLLFQNDRRTIQRWIEDKTLEREKIKGRSYFLWAVIHPLLKNYYKLD